MGCGLSVAGYGLWCGIYGLPHPAIRYRPLCGGYCCSASVGFLPVAPAGAHPFAPTLQALPLLPGAFAFYIAVVYTCKKVSD